MNTSANPFVDRLGALAEPSRLRLLALLEVEELSVSDLEEILQMPQSSVSRHLKLLAEQGWVVARGERTANLYRMPLEELPGPVLRLWRVAAEALADWSELAHDRLRLARRLAARDRGGEFFADVAEEWERLRADLYGELFTGEALLSLLPAHWIVADLACGSGVASARLAPHVAKLIAIDDSPEMLEAAHRRTRACANVELMRGRLEALPLPDAGCDAALLLLTLCHLEDPPRALAEMRRILRPGARAVVVDLLRHDREEFRRRLRQKRSGFAAAELAALLAAAGFGDVRCRPLSPDPKAKGPALLLATGVVPLPTATPSKEAS